MLTCPYCDCSEGPFFEVSDGKGDVTRDGGGNALLQCNDCGAEDYEPEFTAPYKDTLEGVTS